MMLIWAYNLIEQSPHKQILVDKNHVIIGPSRLRRRIMNSYKEKQEIKAKSYIIS